MGAQPTRSRVRDDDVLAEARRLFDLCSKSDALEQRSGFAGEIAALWPEARPEDKAAVGEIYARALGRVVAIVDDAEEAQRLAGRIGGLLALPGLRTAEIAREYASALFHAATFLTDPWERAQRASDIEDLIEEGAPFDRPEIAMSFARLVYATTLIETDPTRLCENLARLERMARGKSAARDRVLSPELGYELAKVILVVAMRCDAELLEGRKDFVLQLVRAENENPGEEFDAWLLEFASVDHVLSDFAIELLGAYRGLREAAERRRHPRL